LSRLTPFSGSLDKVINLIFAMKLHLECDTCMDALMPVNGQALADYDDLVVAHSLQNSPVYEITCKGGHVSTVVIVNPKFELLYQSGIEALKDGYYREAVTSFYVSLERFYEFAMHVLLKPQFEESGREGFNYFWKGVSKQSERQLGAFYMLYLTKFNKCPRFFAAPFIKTTDVKLVNFKDDPVDFRNKIVHAGYIPTYDEALNYGEGVNLYIRSFLREFDHGGETGLIKSILDDAISYGANMKQISIYTFLRFYGPQTEGESTSLFDLAKRGYNPHASYI